MQTLTLYKCDICGKTNEDAQHIQKCEAQGRFDPTAYPIGLMKSYYHNEYVGIFSIASSKQTRDPHYGELTLWACRAPNYPGDTLGFERCRGNAECYIKSSPEALARYHEYIRISDEDVHRPEFMRMVDYLKSQVITPSYYDERGEYITIK